MSENNIWHGTTIVLIRKDNDVVVAGDGQVSMGNTIIKKTATKLTERKINCQAGCHSALDNAIITAPDTRDPDMVIKLEAIAGRVLKQ